MKINKRSINLKIKRLSAVLSMVVVLAMLLTAFMPAAVSASSPSIELDDDSVEAGHSVEITGSDFSDTYYYYIYFDEDYMKSGKTDSDGEFTKSITIPSGTDEDDYDIVVLAFDGSYSDYEDFDAASDDADESAEASIAVSESSDDSSDASIELDDDSITAGDSVEITGSDFTDGYKYYVYFDETYKGNGTIDDDGELSKTITIPSSTDADDYDIVVLAFDGSYSDYKEYDSASDDADESAEASITVESAEEAAVTLSATTGKVGDTFTISGTDFGATKVVTIYWDGTKIGSTFTTSSSGAFSGKEFTVPETYYGSHTIKVIDASSNTDSVSYAVTPAIVLSSTSVASGSTISVSGTGFKASSTITFVVDDVTMTTIATSSSKGTLSSTSVIITGVAGGSHVLKAQDSAGYSITATINVTVPTPTPTTPAPVPTTAAPAPVQTTAAPAPVQTTAAPAPVQTTVAAPVQTSAAPMNNNQPTQANNNQPGQGQQPPQQSSSSSFPVWAIIVIIVVVLIILAVVFMIVRRRS